MRCSVGFLLIIYLYFLYNLKCCIKFGGQYEYATYLLGGAVMQRVRHLGLRSVGRGFKSCSRQRCVTALGNFFFHLRASVTKQYNLVPAKGRWCSAAGEVTAGLAESNGSLPPGGWPTVTCRLTACTPGSAPGPTLGIEYGKPLPVPLLNDRVAYYEWLHKWKNKRV